MTQLTILTPFKQLIDDVKENLNYYNANLRNDIFEKEPNEDNEKAYKRGETIFDKCEDDIRNLTEIIEQQDQMNNFFEKCKENKIKLIKQKNELINKLLRLKKNSVSRNEYLNLREFWNKRREETKDERNRRECEEMLDEIKEERKNINEEKKNVEEMRSNVLKEKKELMGVKNDLEKIIEKAKKEKEEMNVRKEFEKVAGEYVKKKDLPTSLQEEMKYNLAKYQKKQLEEWTELKCSKILFDSNIDDWGENTSVFNETILGKKQLTFLIEDEDGEKFGYYFNTQVKKKYGWPPQETDSKTFLFNLRSKNNRLKQPMKFEIKDLKYGGIELYEKSYIGNLISLGNIVLKKENKKNESNCYQNEDKFDYHGIKNALCGKIYPERFTQKRILVIQMK